MSDRCPFGYLFRLVVQGVQSRMVLVVNVFFGIFKIIFFYFFVAICDLVHDVEALFHLPLPLTSCGNLF